MADFFTESQFIEQYFSTTCNEKMVIDMGGKDTNENLRAFYIAKGFKYSCVDTCENPLVDTVIPSGENLPFPSNSVDLVIITVPYNKISRCNWLIVEYFNEMTRILKPGGFLFIKEPVNKNNKMFQ